MEIFRRYLRFVEPAHFAFDCPACGHRTRIDAAERGRRIECSRCRVAFPAPDFRLPPPDCGPGAALDAYPAICPNCARQTSVTERTAGRPMHCEHCAAPFAQPAAPWERWRRVVSRVYRADDLRRSLHHLMNAPPDEPSERAAESVRLQRWFEFYCGECGGLQEARIWQIATQRRCRICRTVMIVPAPRWRRGVDRAAWLALRQAGTSPTSIGLCCPNCGVRDAVADRARKRYSFCPRCALWY